MLHVAKQSWVTLRSRPGKREMPRGCARLRMITLAMTALSAIGCMASQQSVDGPPAPDDAQRECCTSAPGDFLLELGPGEDDCEAGPWVLSIDSGQSGGGRRFTRNYMDRYIEIGIRNTVCAFDIALTQWSSLDSLQVDATVEIAVDDDGVLSARAEGSVFHEDGHVRCTFDRTALLSPLNSDRLVDDSEPVRCAN